MSTHHVFYDPAGKRQRRVSRAAMLLGLLAAVLTTGFVLSILALPFLPRVPGFSAGRHGKSLLPKLPNPSEQKIQFLYSKSYKELLANIQATEKSHPARVKPLGSNIVAGFYSSDHQTAIHSLRANARRLTHLMPEWLALNQAGDGLDLRSYASTSGAQNQEVIQIARANGLRVCPILNNYDGKGWDPDRVTRLLDAQANQLRLAQQLRDWLKKNQFQGVNLDFETLRETDYKRLSAFVKVLDSVFQPAGLTISLDVEAEMVKPEFKTLFDQCDFVVLMAYDEHSSEEAPGPIASVDWTEKKIDDAIQVIPADRLVLGIGSYAYDWTIGKKSATEMTYQEALSTAQDYDDDNNADDITYDSKSMNPWFEYQGDDGRSHVVWMLDGVTAANQWTLGRDFHLRGAALWSMGQEDPSVWDFLDQANLRNPVNPKALRTVHFPYQPDDEGEGEVLFVKSEPKDGARAVEQDPETGLLTDAAYKSYPSSYVIKRWGHQHKKLALTFDDGPDATYTPAILDELKTLNVPATFFVIGTNAERNPGQVRRMYAEGHEIGSHTFYHPNLGTVSDDRIVFELNATQRAIQSILGRTTILFRPPYNADAEPQTNEEVHPVAVASKMGYLTVGELIDPQDWNLNGFDDMGLPVHRTANDIAAETLQGVHQGAGNVILLHDGGGDRSETAKALRMIVPQLKAEGYEFVTVSRLAGLTRDKVMPPVTGRETLMLGVDKFIFWTVFTFESVLALAFMVAIGLGLGRMVLIAPLAIWHNARRRPEMAPGYRPSVTVLIAAYNEEKVIARTIESVLRSEYRPAEILVVNDGSLDGTSEAVRTGFADEPLVRVIDQENGGKASALNRGIEDAQGEILFCIDADTQLDEKAIGLLVTHFQDPQVGAVAGNVRVGNVVNLLTLWQSIEYTTSQNLDRRAYALMNAITVVPGAVGAWRAAAVRDAGGYRTDTLAEDMDLTWRLRRAGWRLETESHAIAYTEAPADLKSFVKQRFRWAFGTLQCLWKHRAALGRYGWFGTVAIPTLWLFQVVFQALAPLVDLQIIYSVFSYLNTWFTSSAYTKDWRPLPDAAHGMVQVGFLYALFFAVELASALVAFRLERRQPGPVWWLFFQRFIYRQIMYVVIYRSILTAVHGKRQGWGKIERKATVSLPPTAVVSDDAREPAETAR